MLNGLGLRSRLVLLVLVALLPVFGLFTCSAAKNQKTVMALARSSLQSEALLAAAHQQRLVERVGQLLGDIASGPSIKDTRNRLCVQYLKNLQAQDAAYSNLGVVDLNGKISCHAMDTGAEIFIGDRAFFKQVMSGQKFAVGDFAVSRSSGTPGIAFGVPVYNAQGALNGVAYAGVDVEKISGLLKSDLKVAGANLRVLDRNGIIFGSPSDPAQVGTREADALVRSAARAWQPGVQEAVDATGIEMVHAYAPVAGTQGAMFVAISVSRDVLIAAPRSLMLADLAALLGVAALGMACAWAMGKRLVVNPADALLKEASQIAQGNLAARIKLSPAQNDEIGRLGLAFNHMAQSLQAQRSDLDTALRQADGERAMLDLILNSMREGVIAIDTEGRFLLFNATARQIFDAPERGMLFDAWRLENRLSMMDAQSVSLSDGPLAQTLRGASIDNWELVFVKPGADDRILRMSTRPLRGPDGRQVGALTVFIDVTAAKATESIAQAQNQVLALIAGRAPLQQSLQAIVSMIEDSSPERLCLIQQVQGHQLFDGTGQKLPPSLVQALEGLPIAEGVGACGTAAFRKEMVVVENVALDPLMQDYRDLLRAHGLHACWSSPVMAADDEVLATIAILRRTPARPQAADLALMDSANRLARLALVADRARRALIDSDARFRELAEKVEDVFYNVDARIAKVRYVSPGYEKVWGRSCESLYAHPGSYVEAVLPEDQHLLAEADLRNSAGQTADVQYRILTPTGDLRWIRDRSYPVLNAAGAPERVVGTAIDITQRKLAELTLASTNRALEMVTRSSIAINRIHDEVSLLAEVCRVAVEVGGYRMAWVGYALHDEEKTIQPVAHAGEELGYLDEITLCWRDDRPAGAGPAGRAIRTGRPQQSSNIRQGDNQFHWHEAAVQRGYLSAVVLPLCRDGQSFGVLCLYSGQLQQFAPEEIKLLQELADNLAFGIVSLRGRLERRQAQVKLREQASLLDLAPDAIVVRNLDLTVRFWSKGAEQLYGWAARDVMGKTLQDVMYHDPQRLTQIIQNIRAADGSWTGEVEQRASDGSPVFVEMRGTVVRDESGQVNGVMIVNTDINERKQAREEILQLNASLEERVEQRTAQLKSVNQQLEAFSYSVSHDLRGPLSVVNGFCNLLEKSVTRAGGTPLTDQSRHYLARIRAGIGQMGELIDAMLSLAQVSRSSLRWQPVDLSALAEALLLGFREQTPDRQVVWQVEPGLQANGDPRLLRQVLDNLLGNAWKFTSGMASARIAVGKEQNSDGETDFFVRDNGAGFDMAYVEKLFGAFQRLHSQAEFPGTGIGLATVHRIIMRHGGRVWADSTVGQGATFYFTLGALAA